MGLKRRVKKIGDLRGNSARGSLLVSGQTTTTNMSAKSTENTMERSVNKTSEQLTLLPYQNTTCSVQDFLARISQLLESEEDFKELDDRLRGKIC